MNKRSRISTIATGRLPIAPTWRSIILIFTLIAFALQSNITQTHIHFSPGALAGSQAIGESKEISGTGATGLADRHPDKYPADEDPACPLCQATSLAGLFVTPLAVPVLVPTVFAVVRVSPIAAFVIVQARSHPWRVRGPPII